MLPQPASFHNTKWRRTLIAQSVLIHIFWGISVIFSIISTFHNWYILHRFNLQSNLEGWIHSLMCGNRMIWCLSLMWLNQCEVNLGVRILRFVMSWIWGLWCLDFEVSDAWLVHTCCSSLKPDTDVDATRKSTLKKGSKVDFSIPDDPNAPVVEGEVGEGPPENQGAQERWFHLPSLFPFRDASDQSLMLSWRWYKFNFFPKQIEQCVIFEVNVDKYPY